MAALSRTGTLTFGLAVGALFVLHCGGGGSNTAVGHGTICGVDVCYDPAASGLAAVEVQTALDEIVARLAALEAASPDARLTAAEARITSLETKTQFMTVDTVNTLNGLAAPHVLFTGANVHVRNGSGSTATADGLGNLVVGHNEDPSVPFPNYRDGSHNVVVGSGHQYTATSGIIGGINNSALEEGCFLAGAGNTASGLQASVSGGSSNAATGVTASVSGGATGSATDLNASISGGIGNVASGPWASVLGGNTNTANGQGAVVCGGITNNATISWASVAGGRNNTASGDDSHVCGGEGCEAGGRLATVSGGSMRQGLGSHDWVGGTLFEDF
ncbi:MAG: hypothetical protein O7H41_12510 [Planctomycetota bacterium]|nr:hypothetical protein [Planctomycetota bacterium]